MKCYIHPERDVIGTCVGCGKPICNECKIEVQEKNYCKKCVVELSTKAKTGYGKALGIGREKSPGLAAVLSFFIPGVGQIYNGQLGKGIWLVIADVIFLLLSYFFIGIPFLFAIWIYAIFDAYKVAEKINEGELKSGGK